ncbi:uncharacterized protein LOC117064242 [Trachypithecus francoisi]|uniref:uncharacterized protein LOC117064242 n=1 Tax=Trachypithecus francoisi TaxID=54180 RepID=UPI00141B5CC0|nr:uncharacterized protein LOC117064242 [Trachypithecus francoisi]
MATRPHTRRAHTRRAHTRPLARAHPRTLAARPLPQPRPETLARPLSLQRCRQIPGALPTWCRPFHPLPPVPLGPKAADTVAFGTCVGVRPAPRRLCPVRSRVHSHTHSPLLYSVGLPEPCLCLAGGTPRALLKGYRASVFGYRTNNDTSHCLRVYMPASLYILNNREVCFFPFSLFIKKPINMKNLYFQLLNT